LTFSGFLVERSVNLFPHETAACQYLQEISSEAERERLVAQDFAPVEIKPESAANLTPSVA